MFVVLSCAVFDAGAAASTGVVRLNHRGGDLLYSASRISPADEIQFQFPDADGNPACCMKGTVQSAEPLPGDPGAVDDLTGRELLRYRLVHPALPSGLPFIGIAATGRNVRMEQSAATRVETAGDGNEAEVMLCTSQEGVHVISRAHAKVLSHLYIYEEYGIENPTCDASIEQE